jgi:hypothetical protein
MSIVEILLNKIIGPSSRPYSSPPHLTDNQDGGKRYRIDFRDLNTENIKYKFPIANIERKTKNTSCARIFQHLT